MTINFVSFLLAVAPGGRNLPASRNSLSEIQGAVPPPLGSPPRQRIVCVPPQNKRHAVAHSNPNTSRQVPPAIPIENRDEIVPRFRGAARFPHRGESRLPVLRRERKMSVAP